MMHRTNTLDHFFFINGEQRLGSGEKRVVNRGDACMRRVSMRAEEPEQDGRSLDSASCV
jgi:hypothetical protein